MRTLFLLNWNINVLQLPSKENCQFICMEFLKADACGECALLLGIFIIRVVITRNSLKLGRLKNLLVDDTHWYDLVAPPVFSKGAA